MTPQLTAFGSAKGFCQSAILIISNPHRFQLPNDTSIILGFHHLIGFSAELYLKAYLLENGVTAKELRVKPYGHDLKNLLTKAREFGFDCYMTESLCFYLSKHATLEYRYMKENSKYELLPANLIFELLNDLNVYVDNAIGARAAHGLASESEGWSVPESLGKWRMPEGMA